MTREQTREILAAVRPGTSDENDPRCAEALALTKADAELGAWFERQLKFDAALRSKLRQIAPPSHLKEQLLAGRPRPVHVVWFRRPAFWAAAASLAVLLVLGNWWLSDREGGTPLDHLGRNGAASGPIEFATYREKMARIVSGKYKISFKTTDLEKIRAYLAKNRGHVNYLIPPRLEQLPGQGTAVLTWRKSTVSLICLESPAKQTLYLFITNRTDVPDAPADTAPQFAQLDRLASATWSQDDKVYLLMIQGDGASLQDYF